MKHTFRLLILIFSLFVNTHIASAEDVPAMWIQVEPFNEDYTETYRYGDLCLLALRNDHKAVHLSAMGIDSFGNMFRASKTLVEKVKTADTLYWKGDTTDQKRIIKYAGEHDAFELNCLNETPSLPDEVRNVFYKIYASQ